MNLYPLKFTTYTMPKIWGEEIWHLVQMGDMVSVVENGYLAENDLSDLLEIYMGDLVGDHVYEIYGDVFPLLLKIINTKDDLSIQVHPGNDVAIERHACLGKAEMWYVVDAAQGATIISGFNQDTDSANVRTAVTQGHLMGMLNTIEVSRGDVVDIPSGRVHALHKNITVAEIQQNSDITYRLYDYNRQPTTNRPLHLDAALEVLDFSKLINPKTYYEPKQNGAVNLEQSEHFITNLLSMDRTIIRDYAKLDSFVAYMCVEGGVEVSSESEVVHIELGDTVLIPAILDEVILRPDGNAKLLEVYIP